MPRFSMAGAAAGSAKRRWAFMTAVAVPTIAYSGTCGSRSSTSTAPTCTWLLAAALSAAPAEPSLSSQGVATAAAGTIASMPSIAIPSSPPAVRASADRFPESMWPTRAGTSSDENIDPASRP